MDCPFNSPRCLCQYCSLEKCPSCDKENLRCGACVEEGKQLWDKVICQNFTPVEGAVDMLRENVKVMYPEYTEVEQEQIIKTIRWRHDKLND